MTEGPRVNVVNYIYTLSILKFDASWKNGCQFFSYVYQRVLTFRIVLTRKKKNRRGQETKGLVVLSILPEKKNDINKVNRTVGPPLLPNKPLHKTPPLTKFRTPPPLDPRLLIDVYLCNWRRKPHITLDILHQYPLQPVENNIK